jgi:threonine dehydrogenase-like Zn-dependent dehydrogenase
MSCEPPTCTAGDVRLIDAPDPTFQQPTDALVRVVRACVCGSDLHPYHSMPESRDGVPMGHEFIGVVEESGAEVTTLSKGDFVIAPFAVSCGLCEFCRAGLQTSCVNGGFWSDPASEPPAARPRRSASHWPTARW